MSRVFAVKCYILNQPFKFLLTFGSISILLLSFACKVTEGPIYEVEMGLNDYRSLINCIWNVLVTMQLQVTVICILKLDLGKY